MHASIEDTDCFILPATKTRKLHTSRRDAFKPVNTTAWAKVDYSQQKIEFIKKDYKRKSNSKLKIKEIKKDTKVGILRQFTNMFADQYSFFKNYDYCNDCYSSKRNSDYH